MDPQTIIIGIIAFVVSALVIYLISAFTMREKSFEEVIAEQRRRQDEEREKAKHEKKIEKEQLKKKFRKGKTEKSKDKLVHPTETELKEPKASVSVPEVKEPKMVNLEIEPEIIEPSDSHSLIAKPKSKAVKKKPILTNKDEVTPVVEKAPEFHHKLVAPRDEVELKKLHDKDVVSHAPPTHVEPVPKKAIHKQHESKEVHVEPAQKKEARANRQATEAKEVHVEPVHKKEVKAIRQVTEAKEEVKEFVKEVKVQKLKTTPVSMETQHTAVLQETEKTLSKGKPTAGRWLNVLCY